MRDKNSALMQIFCETPLGAATRKNEEKWKNNLNNVHMEGICNCRKRKEPILNNNKF
jgi:hypothetical protein